jgi:SAM-dependent methyltransferase
VWIYPGEAAIFEYSDGDSEEENLKSILTSSTNLNSLSLELEEKFNDWTSEYHLSSLRSNLLRYLDLTQKKTVLELGSGCGALTRYLGEQGLRVDAIEGSQRRADLAKIRCRELPNVDLIAGNIFDLSLPANCYDAIFFVGVMEYAGRFSPTDLSAEASVIQLLNKVRPCLTSHGVIIIAIENRLGRKYLCGAGEDHYGTAFEGINGYPNYSGIKTWSKDEWISLLQDAKLAYAFHYPFPDYKLPTLVLNEHYIANDPNAWARLTGISSRDYYGLMSPQDDLPFWESAHQVDCLGSFSNSFLIIAGTNEKHLNRLTPFDFVQTSTLSRQPQFRMQTRRYQGADIVEKTYLYDHISTNKASLNHAPGAEPWRLGIPLSNFWMQRLRIDPSHKLFVILSTQYFDYLKSRFANTSTPGGLLDLLPMNIMISPSGEWHSFDHEWTTTMPIDATFIFFRGLFYFCQTSQEVLRTVYHNTPNLTLQACLDSWFSAVGLNLESDLEKFIDWEETIQNTALKNRKGVSTGDFLRLRLSARRQTVQLFWALPKEVFSEHQSQTNYISIGDNLQSVSFILPDHICPPISLRFDPGVNKGIFAIDSIHVRWHANKSATCLQVLRPGKSLDKTSLTFENISPHPSDSGQLFYALTEDPYISWQLPTNPTCQSGGFIQIEITLKWLIDESRLPTVVQPSDNPIHSNSPKKLFSTVIVSFLTVFTDRWRSIIETVKKL